MSSTRCLPSQGHAYLAGDRSLDRARLACIAMRSYSCTLRPPQAPGRDDQLLGTFVWHTRVGELQLAARVFTDGSLLDGALGPQCLALGWAFVVIDDHDEVVAAAFGVPPRWVDTIQGAELWALQMALAEVFFPKAIYTDCRTVQQGVQQGTQWLHSSKRR